MIKVELTFSTLEDAHAAISKLAGVDTDSVTIDEQPATTPKPKKETPKQVADKVTKAAFDDKPKKGGKKKAISVEELKEKIVAVSGDDEGQPQRVKDYIKSFGVQKISEMTDEQRQKAFDDADDYFGEAEEEEEEDPMA